MMMVKTIMAVAVLTLCLALLIWTAVKFYYFLQKESDEHRQEIRSDENRLKDTIDDLERAVKRTEKVL